MTERWFLLRSLIDLHRRSIESHLNFVNQMVNVINATPPDPPTQHIVVTGPTTASALAPLPGTELTIFRMIPATRRTWSQCLATNYRFEPTSFVRLFPGCGHYFWYRAQFETSRGVAMCPQCAAEEQILREADEDSDEVVIEHGPRRPVTAGRR